MSVSKHCYHDNSKTIRARFTKFIPDMHQYRGINPIEYGWPWPSSSRSSVRPAEWLCSALVNICNSYAMCAVRSWLSSYVFVVRNAVSWIFAKSMPVQSSPFTHVHWAQTTTGSNVGLFRYTACCAPRPSSLQPQLISGVGFDCILQQYQQDCVACCGWTVTWAVNRSVS